MASLIANAGLPVIERGAPVTTWDELPLILHCEDLARLLGVEVSTVWRRVQQRRIVPKPHSWQRPYLWYRDRVRAEFERGIASSSGRPARNRRVVCARASSLQPAPAGLSVAAVNQALSADLRRA